MAAMERDWGALDAAEAASLIGWWEDAGVDCIVTDEPRDWLAPALATKNSSLALSEVEGRQRARDEGALPSQTSTYALRLQPEAEVYPERRREAAWKGSGRAEVELPDQLPLFQEWLRTSSSLPFAAPSAPRICPSGDPTAGLMIMVAMPSGEDCAAGTLLSGAAGRLFDRMLAAIGRSRETIYLAGLSCLRPAGGRFDAPGARACADIARHHIGLVQPGALLLMGDACCKALLGSGAAQARGRLRSVDTPAGPVAAIATLSPEFLLAQPAAKGMAWADLQLLMDQYQ